MCIRSQTRRRSLIESSLEKYSSDTKRAPLSSGEIAMIPSTNKQPRKKAAPAEKREIQHNYHDHANNDGKIYMETPLVSKGGVTVQFPMKLHNMLEHIAHRESELERIVSWQPHGRCFLVRNIKDFQDSVLPRFFQQRKYASFQRQLNLYGFSRITKGPDRGAYYHELFLRSKSILCRGINRMKVKGTGSRMASNPDQEPNFYTMEALPSSAPAPPLTTSNNMEVLNQRQSNKLEPLTRNQDCDFEPLNINSQPLEIVSSDVGHNESYHNGMSTRALSSYSMQHEKPYEYIEPEPIENVFGDMQFHVLNEVSRRHSLMMDTSRRLSMKVGARGSVRSNSGSMIVTGDNDFDHEMEMIAQLGDKNLSDNELGDILDKIIDHRAL